MSEIVAKLRESADALEKDLSFGLQSDVDAMREAADALEAAQKALAALVELKDQKDAGFKTFVEEERYRALKPAAWERARIIVQGISSGVQERE